MESFQTSEYLQNHVNHRGKCRSCEKEVTWSRERPTASEEEKENFRSVLRNHQASFNLSEICENCQLTDEKVAEIHSKVANFFCRTGISLRIIESIVFKEIECVLGRNKFPNLFKIATPINEMLCSLAIAERTWSIFTIIRSRLRNRLLNERVKKHVVHLHELQFADKIDYILEQGALLNGSECE